MKKQNSEWSKVNYTQQMNSQNFQKQTLTGFPDWVVIHRFDYQLSSHFYRFVVSSMIEINVRRLVFDNYQ